MADVHNPAQRSKNMRAIKNSHTAIEKRLEGLLHELGVAYHQQDRTLAGTPDFVIPQSQCVIFAHGCFWHHHHCYLFTMPATRTEFWMGKIAANVARDERAVAALHRQQWRVLVVWECALRGRHRLSDRDLCERLEEWLCAGDAYSQIDLHGIHSI